MMGSEMYCIVLLWNAVTLHQVLGFLPEILNVEPNNVEWGALYHKN